MRAALVVPQRREQLPIGDTRPVPDGEDTPFRDDDHLLSLPRRVREKQQPPVALRLEDRVEVQPVPEAGRTPAISGDLRRNERRREDFVGVDLDQRSIVRIVLTAVSTIRKATLSI
jgi:hypothetical protein